MEVYLASYGIWAVAFALIIDDIGLPIVGGTILIAYSAFLSAQDSYFLVILLYLIALAIPFGLNSLLYFWGRHGGRSFLKTHGHKFFLPESQLQKLEKFLQKKHGRRTVYLMSLTATTRPYVSLISGSLYMSPQKFFTYNMLGTFTWATWCIGLGYFFGGKLWILLKGHQKELLYVLIGAAAGYLFYYFLARHLLFKK